MNCENSTGPQDPSSAKQGHSPARSCRADVDLGSGKYTFLSMAPGDYRWLCPACSPSHHTIFIKPRQQKPDAQSASRVTMRISPFLSLATFPASAPRWWQVQLEHIVHLQATSTHVDLHLLGSIDCKMQSICPGKHVVTQTRPHDIT